MILRGLELALITLIALLFFFMQPLVVPSSLQIAPGSSLASLTAINGFKSTKLDNLALRFFGSVQKGYLKLEPNGALSRLDFLRALCRAKAQEIELTLIPGETTQYFFRQISQQLGLDEGKLNALYAELFELKEGALWPETYRAIKGIGEKALLELLRKESQRRYEALAKELGQDISSKQWKKHLITASLIQKEAANEQEMPIVSSVIYNRLEKNMRLQLDGSLNYGLFSHSKITPKRLREDKSFYNTYLYDGLPPEPVCNASAAAIRASVRPEKSPYFYFMRDKKTGLHIFSKSLAEHQRAVDAQK